MSSTMPSNRRRSRRTSSLILLTAAVSLLSAGEGTRAPFAASFPTASFAASLTASDTAAVTVDLAGERRSTALVYSCIMPGSGQTMLGHTYKGVAFSVVAFGSVLTAAISHNNFIARNERLDALEYQYQNVTNWVSADRLYSDMTGVHQKLVADKNRRDLFLIVSAVVWAANIVDLLYNTDDLGQESFVAAPVPVQPPVAGLVSPHRPVVAFSIPLERP